MSVPLQPDMIYRVILDYEGLQDGFADRIEDLNVPLTEVDAAGDLTRGNTQKLLVKSDAPWARQFGWESLGKMLKGTGLALALIVDDERFAPIKAEMQQRRMRPRSMLRQVPPKWLFTPQKARKMGKKRWDGVPPEQRSRIMKKVRKAAKAKHRRRQREAVQLEQTQRAAA
jgi:hypothetical protein